MPHGITKERDPGGPVEGEVVLVSIDELDLRFAQLRLVNPRREARLRASIEREGVRDPVLVSTGVEPGRRVLLDGVKRLKVARALGIATVWAVVVEADPCASLLALMTANAAPFVSIGDCQHRGPSGTVSIAASGTDCQSIAASGTVLSCLA